MLKTPSNQLTRSLRVAWWQRISDLSPKQSATALLHHIETEYYKYTAGADQFDDITLLAVRRANQP